MSTELNTPSVPPVPKYPGLRPWKKGQSGCPGGKRKEVARAEKAIAKLLPTALAKLSGLLASEDPHLVIEGIKLCFKYTLTEPSKRVADGAPVTLNVLRPELAAALAEANEVKSDA